MARFSAKRQTKVDFTCQNSELLSSLNHFPAHPSIKQRVGPARHEYRARGSTKPLPDPPLHPLFRLNNPPHSTPKPPTSAWPCAPRQHLPLDTNPPPPPAHRTPPQARQQQRPCRDAWPPAISPLHRLGKGSRTMAMAGQAQWLVLCLRAPWFFFLLVQFVLCSHRTAGARTAPDRGETASRSWCVEPAQP